MVLGENGAAVLETAGEGSSGEDDHLLCWKWQVRRWWRLRRAYPPCSKRQVRVVVAGGSEKVLCWVDNDSSALLNARRRTLVGSGGSKTTSRCRWTREGDGNTVPARENEVAGV